MAGAYRRTVSVVACADFACFTTPDSKVERYSYPFITPAAARGVLDAIVWKPEMRWSIIRVLILPHPDKPHATEPDLPLSMRRNEIKDKIGPRQIWEPYSVNAGRTQRTTTYLRNPCYLIEAVPMLTALANKPRRDGQPSRGPDTPDKYMDMFERRVHYGQFYREPYFGIRECACDFFAPTGAEKPMPWSYHIQEMHYDFDFSGASERPGYYTASVVNGVLHCDRFNHSRDGLPPVEVRGWQDEEAA